MEFLVSLFFFVYSTYVFSSIQWTGFIRIQWIRKAKLLDYVISIVQYFSDLHIVFHIYQHTVLDMR